MAAFNADQATKWFDRLCSDAVVAGSSEAAQSTVAAAVRGLLCDEDIINAIQRHPDKFASWAQDQLRQLRCWGRVAGAPTTLRDGVQSRAWLTSGPATRRRLEQLVRRSTPPPLPRPRFHALRGGTERPGGGTTGARDLPLPGCPPPRGGGAAPDRRVGGGEDGHIDRGAVLPAQEQPPNGGIPADRGPVGSELLHGPGRRCGLPACPGKPLPPQPSRTPRLSRRARPAQPTGTPCPTARPPPTPSRLSSRPSTPSPTPCWDRIIPSSTS